jgi:tRNA-specific 2-thiouridylase
MFPLGDYQKSQVRQLAREYDLPVAERGESQDLCFLGDMDYRAFFHLQGVNPSRPGPIEDLQGNIIGQHQGLTAYTIGQRKGIGISGPDPYYVIQKDPPNNRLIVGVRRELGRDEFEVEGMNWITGIVPQRPMHALARIRYKSREVQSTLFPMEKARFRVRLHESLPDVTPGQAAVFYNEEQCLGGGIISL